MSTNLEMMLQGLKLSENFNNLAKYGDFDSGDRTALWNHLFDSVLAIGGVKIQALYALDYRGQSHEFFRSRAPDNEYRRPELLAELKQIVEKRPEDGCSGLHYGKLFSSHHDDLLFAAMYIELDDHTRWNNIKIKFVQTIFDAAKNALLNAIQSMDSSENQHNLENILDSLTSLLYVSDLDTGEILFINDKMEQAFGIENAKGKICWQVLREGLTEPCDYCPVRKLKAGICNEVFWEENNSITKRYYHNADKLIKWVNGKTVHIHQAIDITDMKMAEKVLYDTMGKLSSYNDLLSTLQNASNTDDALNRAGVKCLKFCHADRATIVQKKKDGYFILSRLRSKNGEMLLCPDEHKPFEDGEAISSLLGVNNDLLRFQAKATPFTELDDNAQTVYIAGIKVQKGLAGFIVIEYYSDHNASQEERDFILKSVPLFENLVIKKLIEEERNSFTENLELSVKVRTHELNEQTKKAQEAQAIAEKAVESKSRFLSNMSHEIRTPMNAIIGITDLLLADKLEGRQLSYVKDIQSSASTLLGVINDIQDLSKIENGKLSIVPVNFDLHILLKNIASLMGFSAQKKGLEFVVEILLPQRKIIFSDEVRIRQILMNYISNAIKFTRKGFVKLSAKIEDGFILFSVSDTGSGIKQKNIPNLFHEFDRLGRGGKNALKGTGLSLYLTKSIAEMLGGSVWAESKYSKGSTFYLKIPYVEGDKDKIAGDEGHFDYISAPTAKILVVDDIQTNLMVAQRLLNLCGIHSDLAKSGFMALELVQKNDYDIVFMDHMMPKMDGVETMQKIRELGEKYKKLPIIALTANVITESKELLFSAGMDDFLAKPIEKAKLNDILKKWLPAEKVKSDTGGSAANEVLESGTLDAASKIDGLDAGLALGRLGGARDMLEDLLKQTAYTVHERLESMNKCLESEHLHDFTIEIHGLKGSLATIGAMRLSERAASLEKASKELDMSFCAEQFPQLSEAVAELAEKLKAVFPEAGGGKKPGGADFLASCVSSALSCLDDFDADLAAEHIGNAMEYDFGESVNQTLAQAREMLDSFDCVSATEILQDIK